MVSWKLTTAKMLSAGWVKKRRLAGAESFSGEGQIAYIEEVYLHEKFPMLLAVRSYMGLDSYGAVDRSSGRLMAHIIAFGPWYKGDLNGGEFTVWWDASNPDLPDTFGEAMGELMEQVIKFHAEEAYKVQFLR